MKTILLLMAVAASLLVDHHFHSVELAVAVLLAELAILGAVFFVAKREYGM